MAMKHVAVNGAAAPRAELERWSCRVLAGQKQGPAYVIVLLKSSSGANFTIFGRTRTRNEFGFGQNGEPELNSSELVQRGPVQVRTRFEPRTLYIIYNDL